MQYTLLYKRKLPHYQPRDGTFFLTLRLAFDIPEKYMLALTQYRESLCNNYAAIDLTPQVKEIIKKKAFAHEDEIYCQCRSEVIISDSPAARIITDKLLEMHQELCYLYAFTIMPNHVHLLLRPLEHNGVQISLSSIIKTFKGVTARLINLALHREGTLWFREYFDHWVRSQQELINVIEYIRNNPVQAGLAKDPRHWLHTWLNPDLWQEN